MRKARDLVVFGQIKDGERTTGKEKKKTPQGMLEDELSGLQMMSSWELNLHLTFKVMFMLLFKNGYAC